MTTDFKIARIRYTWKGNWASAFEYVKDDVVAYGGKTYVCFDTHTSAATFAPDLAAATWVLMLDGYTIYISENKGLAQNGRNRIPHRSNPSRSSG